MKLCVRNCNKVTTCLSQFLVAIMNKRLKGKVFNCIESLIMIDAKAEMNQRNNNLFNFASISINFIKLRRDWLDEDLPL